MNRDENKKELQEMNVSELRRELSYATGAHDAAAIATLTKRLAELGEASEMVRYADMLERGRYFPQDETLALSYYLMAVRKNEPNAALAAAKLSAKQKKDDDAIFFALTARLLGVRGSEAFLADRLFDAGFAKLGTDCLLSAIEENAEAALDLSARFLEGRGVEQSNAHAVWALSFVRGTAKLMLENIRLSMLLRGQNGKPYEAGAHNENYTYLLRLSDEAKKRGYLNIYRLAMRRRSELGTDADKIAYAEILAQGIGGDADSKASAELLLRTGQKGSDEAMLLLAERFLKGNYLDQNTDGGVLALELAAKRGSVDACRRLGDHYAEKKHFIEAMEWYRLGVERGDKECLEKVRKMESETDRLYQLGSRMVAQRSPEGIRALTASASYGNAAALHLLGVCYETGRATKKNRPLAFSCYEYALKQGDETAYFDIGRCYADGVGTAFDFTAALKNLGIADRKGDKRARPIIDRLCEAKRRHMTRSLTSGGVRLLYQHKFDLGAERIAAAADIGDLDAKYLLGCLYEFGIGVQTNRDYAHALYAECASLGYRDSYSHIKSTILKMTR